MKHIRLIILCFIQIFILTSFGLADNTLDFLLKQSENYKDVLITKVISADTFEIEGGEIIRLIGLKAPDPPQKKAPAQRDEYGFIIKEKVSPLLSIEDRAYTFVTELLLDKRVRLEFDADKKTPDYATYAYCFLLEEETFVNKEILRQGYAALQIRPPNKKYEEELREAYREAKNELRGLQGQ